MTNHYDGYGSRYNNKNEDEDDDDNAASGSGSDGSIFDPIATPLSRLGLVEEDQVMSPTAPWPWYHMYLRVGIYLCYKYPINAIVNMRHKFCIQKLTFWTYAAEHGRK